MQERTLELIERENMCKCKKCRMDIMACALNLLPAKYYVTSRGELFNKLNELRNQFKVDVDVAVLTAISMVKKDPRH